MNELKFADKCLLCGKPAKPQTALGRGGKIVETAGAIGIDQTRAVCIACYQSRPEEAEKALIEAEGEWVISQGKRIASDVTTARDNVKHAEVELGQAEKALADAKDRLVVAKAKLAEAERARDHMITTARAAESSARAAQLALGASYASGKVE